MRTDCRAFIGALFLCSILLAACAPQRPAEVRSISTRSPEPAAPIAATSSPTPEPPKATPATEPTKVPPTPTSEPTKVVPTPEARKEFDCGILSPKGCATGEYVEWTNFTGRKSSGMAFTLKAGETISIPEDLHVAGVEQNQSGWLDGFRIDAPRKDGSGVYTFYGDITPVGIGRVGKALPAGTAVGKIAASRIIVFEGSDYNLLITFPADDELVKAFPDQTKNPPRTLNNTPVKKAPGGEVPIFFDVKPPPYAR